MRHIGFGSVISLCFLLTSCGPPEITIPPGVQVRGKVYLPDGKELTTGRLVLLPADSSGFLAFGDIQADGSFTLMNQKQAQSVVPGRYRVYIAGLESQQASLRTRVPWKYQNLEADRSDHEVVIESAVSNLEIRLKK